MRKKKSNYYLARGRIDNGNLLGASNRFPFNSYNAKKAKLQNGKEKNERDNILSQCRMQITDLTSLDS